MFGKRHLVEIRSDEDLAKAAEEYGGSVARSEESIQKQIRDNEHKKKDYEDLLDEVVLEFREQLGIRV